MKLYNRLATAYNSIKCQASSCVSLRNKKADRPLRVVLHRPLPARTFCSAQVARKNRRTRAKSWLVGLGSTGLVVVWVVWFAAASIYVTSDVTIWAPVRALWVHLLTLVLFCCYARCPASA
jgi:hypothetical protein